MSIEPDVPFTGPPPEAEPAAQPTVPPPSGQMSGSAGSRSPLLATLYDLWDVNTDDVLSRCKLALDPLMKTPFLTNGVLDFAPNSIINGKRPDLWGPIWIYLTMVFATFFAATTTGLLGDVKGSYDAGLLTGTAGTLFAFTFAVPVGAWFVIQYLDLVPTLTLMQTISLYGYSGTCWIPAVMLAGSPLGAPAIVGTVAAFAVRGVAIFLAFLMSGEFVYVNLYKVMAAQASQNVSINKSRMMLVLAAGCVLHAAFAIAISLLTFFASKGVHH